MTDYTTRRGGIGSERGDAAGDTPGGVRAAPGDTEGVAATDAYELDDSVVLFDIDNPLAWVEADDAVSLGRMA